MKKLLMLALLACAFVYFSPVADAYSLTPAASHSKHVKHHKHHKHHKHSQA